MSTSIKFYDWLAKITTYVSKAGEYVEKGLDFIDKSRQEIREEIENLAREWEHTIGLYILALNEAERRLLLSMLCDGEPHCCGLDVGFWDDTTKFSDEQLAVLRGVRKRLMREKDETSSA